MKKFLKLCLAVAALTTMFGFASCSNDSSNDSTAPAASVTELKYTDAELAGKIFTYKDGDYTYFYLFYNGSCYNGSMQNYDKSIFNDLSSFSATSPSILKSNDKIYQYYAKFTRQSGEGLYTTWKNDSGTMTFTANGTGSLVNQGANMAFTFTNGKGNLTLTASGTGDLKACYDGTNIYVLSPELTFVENYTPSSN